MASSTWRDGPEWDNNIPLTAQWVKGLPGGAERRERRDGPNSNLWLVLQPKTGAKSWQYRGVALGEEIRTTLGKLVTMTLADARRAHDDLRVKIAKGEYVPPKMSAARAAGEWIAPSAHRRRTSTGQQLQRGPQLDGAPELQRRATSRAMAAWHVAEPDHCMPTRERDDLIRRTTDLESTSRDSLQTGLRGVVEKLCGGFP